MTQSEAQGDAELHQDERVETLLIELSARFISLAPDHVDREIQEAQRRICDYLGFDRSSLFQQSVEDPAEVLLTHFYQRPEMPPRPPGKFDMARVVPWSLAQLRQGKTVTISKLDQLPAEAARDKESLLRVGTKSVVAVPLPIGSGMLGALTFASARERGGWPETLVKRLQLVAEVFGNAIARARSDRALGKNIESVARESMDGPQRYHRPGNVRELRNVIERAMIVARGPKLWIEPPGKAAATQTPRLTMKEVEREHVRRVLEMTGWRVRGRDGAAEVLGVKPTTLESRMAELGIHRSAGDRTK